MKTRENISVELEDIGEGWDGEYNPDDPKDTPLLRFTIYKEGEQVEDGSFCTQILATTSKKRIAELEQFILNEIFDEVKNERSIKRIAERLSWLSAENFRGGK